MSDKIKKRLGKMENRQTAKTSIVVAWDGPVEPKPGQTVIGTGYPFKKSETKKRRN